MDIKITAALIALTGIFISVLASWFVAKRKIDADFASQRYGMKSLFLDKIVDKRIETYPSLYVITNSMICCIDDGDVTIESMVDADRRIKDWDKKNAIFMGESRYSLYLMRKRFRSIIDNGGLENPSVKDNDININELRKVLDYLETDLRVEIGIHSIRHSETDKVFGNYREVREFRNKLLSDRKTLA